METEPGQRINDTDTIIRRSLLVITILSLVELSKEIVLVVITGGEMLRFISFFFPAAVVFFFISPLLLAFLIIAYRKYIYSRPHSKRWVLVAAWLVILYDSQPAIKSIDANNFRSLFTLTSVVSMAAVIMILLALIIIWRIAMRITRNKKWTVLGVTILLIVTQFISPLWQYTNAVGYKVPDLTNQTTDTTTGQQVEPLVTEKITGQTLRPNDNPLHLLRGFGSYSILQTVVNTNHSLATIKSGNIIVSSDGSYLARINGEVLSLGMANSPTPLLNIPLNSDWYGIDLIGAAPDFSTLLIQASGNATACRLKNDKETCTTYFFYNIETGEFRQADRLTKFSRSGFNYDNSYITWDKQGIHLYYGEPQGRSIYQPKVVIVNTDGQLVSETAVDVPQALTGRPYHLDGESIYKLNDYYLVYKKGLYVDDVLTKDRLALTKVGNTIDLEKTLFDRTDPLPSSSSVDRYFMFGVSSANILGTVLVINDSELIILLYDIDQVHLQNVPVASYYENADAPTAQQLIGVDESTGTLYFYVNGRGGSSDGIQWLNPLNGEKGYVAEPIIDL